MGFVRSGLRPSTAVEGPSPIDLSRVVLTIRSCGSTMRDTDPAGVVRIDGQVEGSPISTPQAAPDLSGGGGIKVIIFNVEPVGPRISLAGITTTNASGSFTHVMQSKSKLIAVVAGEPALTSRALIYDCRWIIYGDVFLPGVGRIGELIAAGMETLEADAIDGEGVIGPAEPDA